MAPDAPQNLDEKWPIFDESSLLFWLGDQPRSGLALDIDETLAWTVGHWLARMQTLFGNPEGLSPEAMAEKYHLAQYVPYWQGRPEVEEWMNAQRTSNAMQEELPLIEGAVATVADIQKHTPHPGVHYGAASVRSERNTGVAEPARVPSRPNRGQA
eukprot:EG_transcript_24797